MGRPFRRRGQENLRIEVVGDEFHVIWRVGTGAVAHLVSAEETVARGLYAWLSDRFGDGAERMVAARCDQSATPERIVHRSRWSAPLQRQLAVLSRGDDGWKVVDVVAGAVLSAAHLRDEAEAVELFEMLADPARAAALVADPSGQAGEGEGRTPRSAEITPRPPRSPASRAAPEPAPASRC